MCLETNRRNFVAKKKKKLCNRYQQYVHPVEGET